MNLNKYEGELNLCNLYYVLIFNNEHPITTNQMNTTVRFDSQFLQNAYHSKELSKY